MFGNNNIRCVRDGKEGEGPRRLFFEWGLLRPTGAIEINRDTIQFSRKKNGCQECIMMQIHLEDTVNALRDLSGTEGGAQ